MIGFSCNEVLEINKILVLLLAQHIAIIEYSFLFYKGKEMVGSETVHKMGVIPKLVVPEFVE